MTFLHHWFPATLEPRNSTQTLNKNLGPKKFNQPTNQPTPTVLVSLSGPRFTGQTRGFPGLQPKSHFPEHHSTVHEGPGVSSSSGKWWDPIRHDGWPWESQGLANRIDKIQWNFPNFNALSLENGPFLRENVLQPSSFRWYVSFQQGCALNFNMFYHIYIIVLVDILGTLRTQHISYHISRISIPKKNMSLHIIKHNVKCCLIHPSSR